MSTDPVQCYECGSYDCHLQEWVEALGEDTRGPNDMHIDRTLAQISCMFRQFIFMLDERLPK